jgi:hypothetical protein
MNGASAVSGDERRRGRDRTKVMKFSGSGDCGTIARAAPGSHGLAFGGTVGPTSVGRGNDRRVCQTSRVGRALFAERFVVPDESVALLAPERIYDETLDYNLGPDGRPCVEAALFGSTVTITRADAEPDDDDRAWDQTLASVDTITKAQRDRDHSGSVSSDFPVTLPADDSDRYEPLRPDC